MKCPSCSAPASDTAAECAACGIIFAKWRELQERKKKAASAASAALEHPPAGPRFNPWIGRAIAGAVVGLWMLGMAIYYHRWLEHVRP